MVELQICSDAEMVLSGGARIHMGVPGSNSAPRSSGHHARWDVAALRVERPGLLNEITPFASNVSASIHNASFPKCR
jgi:hypothetical protein